MTSTFRSNENEWPYSASLKPNANHGSLKASLHANHSATRDGHGLLLVPRSRGLTPDNGELDTFYAERPGADIPRDVGAERVEAIVGERTGMHV
jgi:hypothetical protein